MHKGLIFLSSLLPMKYLKPCLWKGSLIDTTVLLISISFFYIHEICIL